MSDQLYTPYGFRDILFDEAAALGWIQERLRSVFARFGYRHVETPLVEYLDVFSAERGSVAPRDMYKFIDREGDLLVLRPDMTPALARMVSLYFREADLPIRITSSGSTFRYNSRYSAKQRQLRQTGIELYGHASSFEDAEVLCAAVHSLKALNLSDHRITIGHARLVSDLMQALKVPADQQDEWSREIESKNVFSLEQKAMQCAFTEDQAKMLSLVTEAGDRSLLTEGYDLAKRLQAEELAKDFGWLLEVDNYLQAYQVQEDVLFDPGMKPELTYYTGVIFKGYVLGAAEPVLDGGRYDALLHQVGSSFDAVGFGFYEDRLLEAVKAQKIVTEQEAFTLVTGADPGQVIRTAACLREKGELVMAIPGLDQQQAEHYAATHQCARIIMTGQEGQVEA